MFVVTLSLLVPGMPAALAGDPADYPEYPYPETDEGAYDEPHRGQFHFSPRSGWMNDPNAPLYYKGTYHLFFQHNPHGLGWDTMHWGHATSPDLVHWTQRPIALEPGVHPGDLWSGAGVVDERNTSGLKAGKDDPIVVFTGRNGVTVNYSTDGAKTFRSYDNGRKVVTPAGESRDPKVFWHGATRTWVMVVWSDRGGNGVDIYTSRNLLDWTFASRFAADWLFECPDLYPLPLDGGRTVRWVLNDASMEYVVGDFDGTGFTTTWTAPQRMDQGRNDPGGTVYAPLTFNGLPGDRIVQIAWQPGNRGVSWTGNASFPAELRLRTFPEGVRVLREPVREIAGIRGRGSAWAQRTISESMPLAGVAGDTYEVVAEFDVAGATASEFGLLLHTRADGSYDRKVAYDRAGQTLYGAPLAPERGRVRMRVLVDRGQLEIFGNDGRLSYSDNVDFSAAPGSRGVAVYATGGRVKLVSLKYHDLVRTWPPSTSGTNPGSNITGPWRPVGGDWTSLADGKTGTALSGGNAFYLSGRTGTDFTYEGDLRPDRPGAAAALTFRASADLATHYTANVDTAGFVRLWRPGAVLADFHTAITPGTSYHLKVVANGPRIRVYFGDGAEPVIDVTDTATGGGYFGLNVWNGTGTIRAATVT
ncbi:glycoside hydrolase family 32 protein [Nonomuraea sp. NPDC050153]|uniref:glycoside hydrolase family 32 protein n=1 Tax=Nonomuraea sp. NPDC050153 TaxID=3364359 RepID=UPI00378837CF